MEKYKIIDLIMVSFIFDNKQRDLLLRKGDGVLEREGNTVWFITPEGKRHESTTSSNIIEVGLEKKSLKKLDK